MIIIFMLMLPLIPVRRVMAGWFLKKVRFIL